MPVTLGGVSVGRDWFARDSVELAPELLGAVVTYRSAEGAVSIRLDELEAYRGDGEDPGSHAFRGRTPRTEVMFGPPGYVYVYFTYGMHTMMNVVTEKEGRAAAVLVRAGEVVGGLDLARMRRPNVRDRDLARGPARSVRALGVTLALNGTDLLTDPAWSIELATEPVTYRRTARTGVSGAGGADVFDWRFAALGPDGRERETVLPHARHPKSHR